MVEAGSLGVWPSGLEVLFFLFGVLFLVGSLDDLFIDVVHGALALKPRRLSNRRWFQLRTKPESQITVLVPAWKEDAVLEAMIRTNLGRIRYLNYRWMIGVYPNDSATLAIAHRLKRENPEEVEVVVCERPGPTSKAHCLNQLLAAVAAHPSAPDWVVIHDAEDVIHPDSFTLINGLCARADFVQIPILSLPVSAKKWVAGTYLDEFAEIHLKELPTRSALKMPIPSAGVGTYFRYEFLERVARRFGYAFDENNLTEDYEISLRLARIGARQKFLLVSDVSGSVIATREYFPEELGRSIRQKTRWTTGIGLQTYRRWGFFGFPDFMTAYALWRDRKALWANPAVLAAWTLILITAVTFFFAHPDHHFVFGPFARALTVLNTVLFGVRIVQRVRFTAQLYGKLHAVLAAPRVLVSTYINGLACLFALRSFAIAQSQGRTIAWDKTEHQFPKELETPTPPSERIPPL